MSAPVRVSKAIYAKVDAYCEQTGVPRIRVIEEALSDWLDTVGQARLEALKQPQCTSMAEIVKFPAAVSAN